MSFLPHLHNGAVPGRSNGGHSSPAPGAPPIASGSMSTDHRPKSKKKRPSRAAAAFLPDDDPDGIARRSSRHSTRPKRYADELYEDQEALMASGFDGSQTAYNAAFAGRNGDGTLDAAALAGTEDAAVESDEEGNGLLRATSHIWREPLQSYILTLHARQQQVARDFARDEQSRAFATAARVVDMSERRVVEMRARKDVRLVEVELEQEQKAKHDDEEKARADQEEAKRAGKEKDKEERLRKQREAAKKKRDEERAKKERDEEVRRVRGEKERQAKIAEQERRNALSPEDRAAEDQATAERKQREADEAMLRVKELEDDLLGAAEGRGARKKRRLQGDEDDAARALSGLSGPSHRGASYSGDDLDDPDDPYSYADVGPARSRSKGKGSSRSSAGPGGYDYYAQPGGFYPPPAVDALGNPIAYPYGGYPPPLLPGSYVGADRVLYAADGQPLSYPPPPYPMMPGYPHPTGSPGHPYPPGPSSGAPYGDYDNSLHGGDGTEEEENLPMTGKGSRNPKVLATKRWKAIEDLERRVWTQIAKRDIPKVVRVSQQSTSSRQFFAKRISTIVSREARRAAQRTKGVKDVQTRAKKVMREMMVFMKGNEKKERETRKKAEKEALDKAKKEEDLREAKRAARKLNFLITQTELYSHFVGSKIKTKEAEDSEDTASDAKLAPPQQSASLAAAIAAGDAPEGSELKELDFDVDDETNAAHHARRNAQAAVDAAKNAAAAFDAAAAAGGVASSSKAADGLDFAMDFQNPSGMKGDVQVKQPKLLTCTLKEYQLKGLNWLANLYEQGINGILADEMGLGKTVQSISLMAYLAEVHNIWGPFLVIAPASTLHNWQQEITRFVPGLKALPYWGNTKDRAILRKFWNRKSLRYDKDAPFHILVTSYQLVVQDEKYFQGVKWQYMVLDEAQAIKSSTSARWKTLLGFRCRNRLLLTGTPIQNSMHELWALLHFIMPSLFDSHDEFSEWFSKDIEGNAENKGAMNEHQLRRLHMILKPFMLRRIKKNVQNELGDKIEIDLYCDLTPRQKGMYRTLRENISITDLVSRASSLNDDDSVKRLMNLIMQFRKVCNHPELFERADVTAPLAFGSFSETANITRDPDVLEVPYATKSVIEYRVPKLLYRDGGILTSVGENSRAGSDTRNLKGLFNIWTPEHIQRSLSAPQSAFAFTRGMDLSPAEVSNAVSSHGILRVGLGLERLNSSLARHHSEALGVPDSNSLKFDVTAKSATLPFDQSWRALGLTPLAEIEQSYRLTSRLSKPDARFYMDTVVAPTINAVCNDRSFVYDQDRERFDPLFSAALFGLPSTSHDSPTEIDRFERALPGFPAQGVLAASERAQLPFPPMQVPQLQKLILDSGKLAKLDTLLTELKANGHRVLVYFQMTRMIDLMEEYLAFRQYKYLRLDGGSTISERRDMVMDWQTKPELFIFLLSTRAGGLGINLTAADTVIFYDSDWNPSNDLQAMDRAHRLGQTKQVTVYRLITKDTVDERIVQLARNKKLVQDAVVGSSSMSHTDTGAAAKTNEVVSLLLGEDELEEGLRQAELKRKRAEEKQIEDGKRGAQRREDNKTRKALEKAELAEAKKKEKEKPSWGADDDEDAFSFFTASKNTAADEDEDGQPSGTGADTPKPKAKPKPRKRKEPVDGADGAPKPPKKPRAKKGAAAAATAPPAPEPGPVPFV
ncbi:hypothetical protein RQP46_009573 [Phenoliferia psychrophenolica]